MYLRGARTLHPFWSCSVYKEHDGHDHINTDWNLVVFFFVLFFVFTSILERKNTCVNKTNHAIPLDGDLHIPSNNQDGPQFTIWKVDSAIHRRNRCPVNKCSQNKPRYSLDFDHPVDSVIHLSNNSVASHIIKHLITCPQGGILSVNIEVRTN